MFSYRHAFHAGNHADVLKHATLVHVIRHLAQKDKAFWVIDTHAGAATYSLKSEQARKRAEFETGIAKLWGRADLPGALEPYMEVVRADNPDGTLRYYPGSPWIADHLLRTRDRLRLFELHSTEIQVLQKHFRNSAPRVIAQPGDGFEAPLALLPPPPRRGLVLIDPSYEDKRDYRRVIGAVKAGLERFATGTFMVWYPQVVRPEAKQFPDQLKRIRPTQWLHATLSVKAPPADGVGLFGSGLFIINPPFTLPGHLDEVLPWLARTLGQDARAGFSVESRLA